MAHGRSLTQHALLSCSVVTLLGASVAAAQTTRSDAEIGAQYQADRAACLSRSNEDRESCIREAGAAQAAARRGQLDEDGERFRANALMRCTALPPADRDACRMRMEGQGTTKGSVESGGIYRELVTREIGLPPQTAPEVPAQGEPPAVRSTAPPEPTQAPGPTQAPARPPGAPSFTPVQPIVPGRSAAPLSAPMSAPSTAPAIAPTPSAPSTNSGPTLQITPPASPVQQVPGAAVSPQPGMPSEGPDRTR